jgi:hypothetical protein
MTLHKSTVAEFESFGIEHHERERGGTLHP